MFTGIITALITPFKNGRIDEKAYQDLIEWQIAEGVDGLVPCGTTGESPTLSHEEHMRLVELCVEASAGRVPVIAGTGSNSTEEAISLTSHAKQAGANGALIVAPYYNKPTQEGIYQHFKAIHDQCDLPIVIYNIPGRSVINITDETIARLAKLPKIVGVKDATGDLTRPLSLGALVERKDFSMLSGEDITALAFNANGGKGCISVTSNIAPKFCAQLQDAWVAGDIKEAMRLTVLLYGLSNSMFLETNPAPVKYAASLLGICESTVRLPLVEGSEGVKARVKKEVEGLKLQYKALQNA